MFFVVLLCVCYIVFQSIRHGDVGFFSARRADAMTFDIRMLTPALFTIAIERAIVAASMLLGRARFIYAMLRARRPRLQKRLEEEALPPILLATPMRFSLRNIRE